MLCSIVCNTPCNAPWNALWNAPWNALCKCGLGAVQLATEVAQPQREAGVRQGAELRGATAAPRLGLLQRG